MIYNLHGLYTFHKETMNFGNNFFLVLNCHHMSIGALFTIAKRWKQPNCPSTEEQINKLWYILTIECYSATKRNEVLPHTTTRMNLENIMLRSQTQKVTFGMIPLI